MGKPNIYWRMNKDSPASESTVNLRCPIASNDRRPSHSAQASTYTILCQRLCGRRSAQC